MENFFLLFFIPVLMIIFGLIMWRFTPGKNGLFGYRSENSLRNQETWDYANKTCGFFWFFAGAVLIGISGIILFIFMKSEIFGVLRIIKFIIDMIAMLAAIPYTEIKLKKKFKN